MTDKDNRRELAQMLMASHKQLEQVLAPIIAKSKVCELSPEESAGIAWLATIPNVFAYAGWVTFMLQECEAEIGKFDEACPSKPVASCGCR